MLDDAELVGVAGPLCPYPRARGYERLGDDLALDPLREACLGGGDPRLLVVVAAAGDRVLELAEALAGRLAELGQLLRADDHQGDDQHDRQLHWSDVGHRLLFSGEAYWTSTVAFMNGWNRQ